MERPRTRCFPPPPAGRRFACPFAAALLLAGAGCGIEGVDLGSNRAPLEIDAGSDAGGSGGGGPTSFTTEDCPSVTEAEIHALYGHPCDSSCESGGGKARVVASAAELVAVTAGQWLTCSGDVPWADDVVGIEFQAGCTLFLLHAAPGGAVVRGITPDDQGTFDVVEAHDGASVTRSLKLRFPAWTWYATATTSDCPHRLLLVDDAQVALGFAAIPSGSAPLD